MYKPCMRIRVSTWKGFAHVNLCARTETGHLWRTEHSQSSLPVWQLRLSPRDQQESAGWMCTLKTNHMHIFFFHYSFCVSGANICTSDDCARLGLGQGSRSPDCSTEPLEASQDIPSSSVFPPSASPSPRNDDWQGTPPSLETETHWDSSQHFQALAFKAKT